MLGFVVGLLLSCCCCCVVAVSHRPRFVFVFFLCFFFFPFGWTNSFDHVPDLFFFSFFLSFFSFYLSQVRTCCGAHVERFNSLEREQRCDVLLSERATLHCQPGTVSQQLVWIPCDGSSYITSRLGCRCLFVF